MGNDESRASQGLLSRYRAARQGTVVHVKLSVTGYIPIVDMNKSFCLSGFAVLTVPLHTMAKGWQTIVA